MVRTNPRYKPPPSNTHRFTLWTEAVQSTENEFLVSVTTFTMGEHGSMQQAATSDRMAGTGADDLEHATANIASHNIQERNRATEELRKWEQRMNDSPLGKTQQDFVAYYSEVAATFTEWCKSRKITIPE